MAGVGRMSHSSVKWVRRRWVRRRWGQCAVSGWIDGSEEGIDRRRDELTLGSMELYVDDFMGGWL